MGPDRRHEISDLYHAALARAPGDRNAFLEEVSVGEPTLRRELDSLLQYASESAAFLETPPAVFPAATPSVDDTSHLLGRDVGPYRIVALLGRDGMGEVYRARDSKLKREAAIKILPPHLTGDPDRRARLIREARLLATLNHPHIGAIYGVEETGGLIALALELVGRSPSGSSEARCRGRESRSLWAGQRARRLRSPCEIRERPDARSRSLSRS
jgi:eukaryotic-like serine/threonine-protein kinase